MKRTIVFLSLFGLAVFLDCLFQTDDVYIHASLLLGAAVLGGSALLGNTISGIMNNNAISNTNAMNLEATRETNKVNREMFNEQMDYNKYMYEDQKSYNNQLIEQMNDYNSAKSQRQRLEDAGYNPYLAYGNVDAGSMQSAISPSPASAPSAPTMQTPHFQPMNYDFIGNGIRDVGSVMNSYFQNSNIAADTVTKSIDNITRLDENIARLEGLRANNQLTQARQDELDEQITNLRQMRNFQMEQLRLQNANLQKDSDNKTIEQEQRRVDLQTSKLQRDYQSWFNDWSKDKGAKEISQLGSLIMNIKASTSLAIAQELSEKAKKFGLDIDNEQKKQLVPLLVRAQKLQNEQTELENKYGSNFYSAGGRWYERLQNYKRKNLEKSVGFRGTTRW